MSYSNSSPSSSSAALVRPELNKEQLCVRLRELHYDTDFPDGAVPILNHLLTDLLKSVKSFHGLRARCEDVDEKLSAKTKELDIVESERDHLRTELENEKSLREDSTSAGCRSRMGPSMFSPDTVDSPDARRTMMASKLSTATEKVSELEDDLERAQGENGKLQEQLETLQIELKRSKNACEAVEARERRVMQEWESQEKRLQDSLNHEKAATLTLKTELKLKQQEAEDAQAQLERYRNSNEAVAIGAQFHGSAAAEAEAEMADMRQRMMEIEDQKASLQKHVETLTQRLSGFENTVRDSQKSVSDAEKDAAKANERVFALESQLDEERTQRRNAEREVNKNRSQAQPGPSYGSMGIKLQQMEKKKSDLEYELETVSAECRSLTNQVTESRAERASLEEKLEKSMHSAANKDAEISRLQREHERERNQLELDKSRLAIEAEKHLNTASHLRADIEARKSEIVSMHTGQVQEVEVVQRECVALAQQNQRLQAEMDRAESARDAAHLELEKNRAQLLSAQEESQKLEDRCSSLEEHLNEARRELEAFAVKESRAASQHEHLQDERVAQVRDSEVLRKQIRELQLRCDSAVATEQHLETENKQEREKNRQLEQRVAKSDEDFRHLKDAYKTLSNLRDQVQEKLNEAHNQLTQMKADSEKIVREHERSQENTAGNNEEKEALRQALFQMDIERDAIREEADRKTMENRELRISVEEGTKMRLHLEEVIEDLRRKNDLNGQQLTDRERNLQEHVNALAELKHNLDVIRADNLQNQRDAGVYRADLNTMTKENQALNEHVTALTSQIQSMDSEKAQIKACLAKESSEHSIRTMERDDMLQLYKETVTENQRLERTLNALQNEKGDAQKKFAESAAANQSLQLAEEKAVAELRQEQMNVSSLKTQVSQLVARLQESSQHSDDRARRERELEREIFLSGQNCREMEGKRVSMEREVLMLKAELDKQIQKNAQLKNDVQVQEAATAYEKKRAEKLEVLMTEHRRRQVEFDQKSGDFGGRMDDESEQTTMMLYDTT